MDQDAAGSCRPVLFVRDEYQAFATTGAVPRPEVLLARPPRAVQSVGCRRRASARCVSALTGESWRTLRRYWLLLAEALNPLVLLQRGQP
jgi:hypothetical protein